MSSQSIQEDNFTNASPVEGKLPDLYVLLSERSSLAGKIAFWIGLAIGLWLLLGAYETNDAVSAPEALIPTWHDWVWTGLAGIGIIVSLATCSYLMSLRKPGDPPYDLLAAIGGAVSIVIVVVMLFEYIESLRSMVSPDGGVLWPEGKPLWFLPLSVLGVTLPMVALLLVRKGDIRDQMLGLFLSCAPLIVLSLPFMLGLDEAGVVRWMPTIYLVTGMSLMLAGLRPFDRSSKFALESMEYLSSRALAVMLVFVGVVSWRIVSSDDVPSSSMDAVWLIPLVTNLVIAVALLAAVNNSPRGTLAWARSPTSPSRHWSLVALLIMSFVTIAMSVTLLSLFVLGYLDVLTYPEGDALYPLSLPRSVWLYPMSLLGVALIMMSVNLIGSGTFTDRAWGLSFASLPVLVAAVLAILSDAYLVHPLLSGSAAFLVFIGLAAAVIVSGMNIETFFKSQLPVMREKSALNRKKYTQILRQVSRNVMGVIGIGILIVFVVMAVIGPYVAPYEVDMTINGQFERLLPESSEHLMGTDVFGHDVFSQLLYGAKTSITVGVIAAFISSFLGATIGLYSGYVGGWKDEVIMRLNDISLSIPWLVLMIIIAAFMGSIDLTGIILVIGLTGWS
ncbi:MAG: peptide/nickel transport system permease protein, partial [Candidatus Thermoplasmatota archaeon]|nr:peptide/nickel transport system permease protein [Candidatus Thermoplasmatota archaeon]